MTTGSFLLTRQTRRCGDSHSVGQAEPPFLHKQMEPLVHQRALRHVHGAPDGRRGREDGLSVPSKTVTAALPSTVAARGSQTLEALLFLIILHLNSSMWPVAQLYNVAPSGPDYCLGERPRRALGHGSWPGPALYAHERRPRGQWQVPASQLAVHLGLPPDLVAGRRS